MRNIFLLYVITLLGCKQSIKDGILYTYYPSGKIECECQVNALEEKDGKCICYFPSDTIKEISYWWRDSIRINETYLFYPSGKIKEYNFYDLLGDHRYARKYHQEGSLLSEEGDFLSHSQVSSSTIKLGDTLVARIYIATPPHCSHKVWGIDKNGRYVINNTSNINYIFRTVIKPHRIGTLSFAYEIEFMDSISSKIETRKSQIVFTVE